MTGSGMFWTNNDSRTEKKPPHLVLLLQRCLPRFNSEVAPTMHSAWSNDWSQDIPTRLQSSISRMALVHAGCRPSIGVIYHDSRSKTWCENSESSLRSTSAAEWIPADCHLEDVQPGEQHHPVGIISYNIHRSFQSSFSDNNNNAEPPSRNAKIAAARHPYP